MMKLDLDFMTFIVTLINVLFRQAQVAVSKYIVKNLSVAVTCCLRFKPSRKWNRDIRRHHPGSMHLVEIFPSVADLFAVVPQSMSI